MKFMKSGALRGISTLLLTVIAFGTIAQAAPVASAKGATERLPASFKEVSDAEADRIAPLTSEFWDQYNKGMEEQRSATFSTQSIDVGTINVGLVVLDVLVNIGKSIWALVEAGRAKIDLNLNVASAVPEGIKSWAELDRWKDPISKLYKTQLLTGQQRSLGDVYYRLVYTYGGSYQGKGSYLTNVTIVPAQIRVPYHKNFYAKTQVTEIVNHGTKKDPIAGLTMLLQWGLDTTFGGKTLQSISLHVRGDGDVKVLPSADDQPTQIHAPVKKVPR